MHEGRLNKRIATMRNHAVRDTKALGHMNQLACPDEASGGAWVEVGTGLNAAGRLATV